MADLTGTVTTTPTTIPILTGHPVALVTNETGATLHARGDSRPATPASTPIAAGDSIELAIIPAAGTRPSISLISAGVSTYRIAPRTRLSVPVTAIPQVVTVDVTGTIDPETIQDQIGAVLAGVGAIDVTYNDAAGTVTVSAADAGPTTKGVIRLAGDLAGPASAPTVPSLAGKLDAATLTAKGDLLAATGPTAPARLPAGTNGQVLTADSTAGTGLRWATPSTAGAVLMLNVADYGAVGDCNPTTYGGTDNTAAFNAAIVAATAATLTGRASTVWVPPGNYLIPSLTLPNRVVLQGAGAGTSRLYLKGGASSPVVRNATHARLCTVADLTIDGNRGNVSASGSHGVLFDNTAALDTDTTNGVAEYVDGRHYALNLLIQNCKGTGLKQAGRGATTVAHVQSWVCDGHGFDCDTDSHYLACDTGAAGLDGFIIRSGSNRFVGCKAWYSGRVATTGETGGVGHGFHFADGNYSANVLTACTAQDNGRAGFYLSNVGRQTLAGCEADSNNTGNLGHAGVEMVNAYINTYTGFTWDRAANATKQLAGLRVTGGGANKFDVRFDGAAQMPQGRLTTDSDPRGHTVIVDAQESTVVVAYAATLTPDPYAGCRQLVALTGNMTVNAPAEAHAGQTLTFVFTQDATGGRVVTFAVAYKTSWTQVTTANAIDSVTFLFDGTSWIQTAKR